MVKTALVVEDDSGIQSLVKEALEGAGLQVMIERDGDWALKALERRLPDVLVTDLLLPTMGGFELLDKLRAMPGGDHVPVVVMSGIYRSARHKKQAREKHGVTAYFDKPFSIDELVTAVKEAAGVTKAKARPAPSSSSSSKPVSAASAAKAAEGTLDDPLADFDTRLEKDQVESASSNFPAERTVRGNLKNKRFPEVLSQLYRWKATGALLLRRGRIKKIVYLKDGYPIFVKSNLLSECLGRILVREKMITEEECEKSLELLKTSPGKQQGTVLIEQGAISPHNLVFGLQLQLEQKLFDIFGWGDGDYQFNAKIEIPTQAVHLDMSLATVVSEGVRRKFTDQQVSDLLEPFLDLYLGIHPEPSHRFQEVPLEADERNLLALVDGRRTMREVIEKSGMPKKAAQKLVYSLFAAELIQPATRQSKKAVTLETGPPAPSSSPPPLPPRKKTDPSKPPPLMKKAGSSSASSSFGSEPALMPGTLLEATTIEELRTRLVERARLLKRQNHFEALGVSKRASVDEIQRAYFALVRELHPDRLRRSADGAVPADARALAEQIHNQLTTAFETLSDERRRQDYTTRLDQGQKTAVSEDLSRLLGAETRYRKGESAFENGRLADAAKFFEEACNLYPDEGEFQAAFAWAVYQQTPDDAVVQVDVIARLQKATELAPRHDKGWLWLGKVLQRSGRPGEALKQFERALHCNPDNRDAQSELKLLAR
ncbi:MAG: response regulator [Deltaproteobacteria bacterium]|nr:response regulator [Deltaproteobacteria bacterium]